MKFNKFFIVLVVLLAGFLLVNASAAAELDDSVIADDASSNQDISVNDVDNNVKAGDTGSNNDISNLRDSGNNFKSLNDAIQNCPDGGEVNLTHDYKYDSSSDAAFKNGIVIDKSITINGNGFTINGSYLTRAFNVTADNVAISYLNFSCFVYDNNDGGAVYWSGDNGFINNCIFDDCAGYDEVGKSLNGGAVYWSGDNGAINGSTFLCADVQNNGGAVYWSGNGGSISNSDFKLSNSDGSGGAVYWSGDNGIIFNSSFAGAHALLESHDADNGGAIYWDNCVKGTVNQCFFINLFSVNDGGVIYGNNVSDFVVVNSSFTLTDAGGKGGAIYCNDVSGSIKNSIFMTCCGANSEGKVIYLKDSDVTYEDNFWGTINTISAKDFKDSNLVYDKGSKVPNNFVVLKVRLTNDSYILEFINNGTDKVVSMPDYNLMSVDFTDGSSRDNIIVGKKYKLNGKSLIGAVDLVHNLLAAAPFDYNITTKIHKGTVILTIDTSLGYGYNYIEGIFTVKANGKIFKGKLENGSVSIPLTGLKPGKYTLDIYYSGDKYNLPFNTTFDITVPKPIPKPDSNPKKGIPMEATGNPLIALLFALITLPILRRK